MTAEAVARSSLKALARRRAGHVPGVHYQVLAFLSRITPWSISRRIVTMGSDDFKRARP
jgi:short-subunit dehydrogenase